MMLPFPNDPLLCFSESNTEQHRSSTGAGWSLGVRTLCSGGALREQAFSDGLLWVWAAPGTYCTMSSTLGQLTKVREGPWFMITATKVSHRETGYHMVIRTHDGHG